MSADETTREHAHGHDHSHGHGHSHGGGSSASSRKLALVAGINIVGFLAELAGGLLFGSVALLSDAVHMLFDALAYIMAFAAAYVAENYAGAERWSYGLHRLEPLTALLNGLLLVPMVGFILWEAYQRVLQPVDIATGGTLLIAVGGLAVNVVSVFVLTGEEMSLNEKGAFYHLLGDAGGSVAVIVSVLVVEVTDVQVIDPIAAALIAGVVLWSAGKVLWGSGAIFFLRSPLDPGSVREEIEAIEGVAYIHDWHAWQICSQITVVTTHVATTVEQRKDGDAITRRIHEVLRAHGVDHATVELCPADTDHSHLDAHSH
jgi:cobalt-zinc-cadmium efflux system protein